MDPKSSKSSALRRLAIPLVAALVLAALFGIIPRVRDAIAPGPVLRHEADIVLPDGTTLAIQLADTDATRERGLGGVRSLTDSQGMLFLFPTSAIYTFWMKDMRIPIDIVWIQDGVVVDRQEHAPVPITPIPTEMYRAEAPANMILELADGGAARHGLTVGAHLDIKLPAGYSAPTNP